MKLNLNLLKGRIYKGIRKANKKVLLAIGILVLLLIIGLIFRVATKKKTYNIAENLYNGGMVAQEGKTVYYYNVNDNAIYRKKINSNKEKKIIEANASYLNIDDEYIYYIEKNERYDLVKIKKNGENRELVIEDVNNKMMTVIDGNIYYFKEEGLYRIKTNGKDNIKISDKNIINYQVVDKWIYYIYDDGEQNVLAKMTTYGEKNLKLRKGVAENFLVKGKKIYYVSQQYNSEKYRYEYVLCKTKTNGKKTTEILELPSTLKNINITKKAVYYTETEDYDTYNIFMHEYKKEPKLLTIVNRSTKINVINEWVFYTNLNDNQIEMNYQIKVD